MTGLLTSTHVLLLLVVVLVLFGAKRLPELGRSLGSGLREFKHSISAAPDPDPGSSGGGVRQLKSAEQQNSAPDEPSSPAA